MEMSSWNFAFFESLLLHLEIGIVVALLTLIVWFLFFKPLNLFIDVTQLSFESISKQKGCSNAYKRAVINELRHKRKIGEDLPPPFPNGWFAILECFEIPLKGVKEVSALGHQLVAWRGESGKCYVANAYCPHLGAHLGVGGKVVKDCIQCPFHSWTFHGSTGKVENIPYSQTQCSPTTAEIARLKMWNVVERYGFTYIWHHADGSEPTWSLPEIPEVETGRWRYRGRTELHASCHIQEIPENGADVAHLRAVHTPPAIHTKMDLDKEWNIIKHTWGAKWAAREEPGRRHEAVSIVEHHLALFNDSFRVFGVIVEAQQIGPGIVLLHFDTLLGKGVLVQNVTPLEPLLQKIVHRFYSAPTLIHPIGLTVLYTEAVQISRDIRIWNRKCFLRRPVLVKEDYLISKFRRWYSQFYSEGSAQLSIKEYSNGHSLNSLVEL